MASNLLAMASNLANLREISGLILLLCLKGQQVCSWKEEAAPGCEALWTGFCF